MFRGTDYVIMGALFVLCNAGYQKLKSFVHLLQPWIVY